MSQPIHTPDDDKPPYQAGPVRVGTFQDNNAIAPYWFIETAYDTHEIGPSRITHGQMDDSPWAYANARLLAAAYNAFDTAAKKLGVNAVNLAERMQDDGIASLVKALNQLVELCEHCPANSSGKPMAPILSLQGAGARKALSDAHAALAQVKAGAL